MCLQVFGYIFWVQLKIAVLITFELWAMLAWIYYCGKAVCLTSERRLSLIFKAGDSKSVFPFSDIDLK